MRMMKFANPARLRLTLACGFAWLFAGPLMAPAWAGDVEDYQNIMQRAKAAFDSYDTKTARLAYQEAIRKLDSFAGGEHAAEAINAKEIVYAQIGRVDERMSHVQDAENDYKQSLALFAENRHPAMLQVALFSSARLQTLYFLDRDYPNAKAVAEQSVSYAGTTSAFAQAKLDSLITIARCDAAQDLLPLAKTEFDTAWDFLEGMDYSDGTSMGILLSNSTNVYGKLHLDQLVTATNQRAQRLYARNEERIRPMADALRPKPEPAPAPANQQGGKQP